jgi:hypothetical protein
MLPGKVCGDVIQCEADNLKTHTSAGSLLVRSMLTKLKEHLYLATCSGRIINLEAFSSSGKLPVVEIRVFSITCQQFFVSAALGNLSFVYDDDCGGVTDSRETVRNDE